MYFYPFKAAFQENVGRQVSTKAFVSAGFEHFLLIEEVSFIFHSTLQNTRFSLFEIGLYITRSDGLIFLREASGPHTTVWRVLTARARVLP